ncbi:hypothetical protein SRABI13_00457 [Erwinia aphidicola]|uniref:hypothetical protein n=1 Tax=Erwinia aphidicola TaxID=68334 RepID=UPI001D21BA80|nr:hypothetical protein [Erwinia aphidicola]CAH0148165.1 hypothetical protein SRABI13_00457 [Erwinia aphidicola]
MERIAPGNIVLKFKSDDYQSLYAFVYHSESDEIAEKLLTEQGYQIIDTETLKNKE